MAAYQSWFYIYNSYIVWNYDKSFLLFPFFFFIFFLCFFLFLFITSSTRQKFPFQYPSLTWPSTTPSARWYTISDFNWKLSELYLFCLCHSLILLCFLLFYHINCIFTILFLHLHFVSCLLLYSFRSLRNAFLLPAAHDIMRAHCFNANAWLNALFHKEILGLQLFWTT